MPTNNATYDRILDNHFGGNVHQRLDANLRGADVFRAVSAYFSIYGYGLLADALMSVSETRFLFGEPSSASDVDPGEREGRAFELGEDGALSPAFALSQKALAQRCQEWVESGKVEIRSIDRSNFLHGKMYLTDRGETGAGIVGSSNFTQRGLGGGGAPNIEINLTADEAALAELRDWFDRLWADKTLTRDAKKEVLNALKRIGMDYSPEAVYYKTLFELFREEMDARRDSDRHLQDIRLYDTDIWKTLYEFQRDGAKSAIGRLHRHGGCILADSVGLGKTYTALAVIKYFEIHNARVLVLCPRKLHENWRRFPHYFGESSNPFKDDRFAYSLLSHTDLSRKEGKAASGIDLENFDWGAFDLVVIDESHNFRNMGGERYKKLMDEVVKSGARTKVLMLSATPVNTSLKDLRSQISLITRGRDDAFRKTLAVPNAATTLNVAQRAFKRWEESNRRGKEKLIGDLGAAFFRLLGGVSIARSRRQITAFYQDERVGEFPKHEKPANRQPRTDLKSDLSYDELSDSIDAFSLAIYNPTKYLLDESQAAARDEFNFTQADRESYLIAMMKTNFLKRLESSPHSMALTLERAIAKMDAMLEKIAGFGGGALSEDDVNPDGDEIEEDEDFAVNKGKRQYKLSELDLTRWSADLRKDKAVLSDALRKVKAVTPERDGKLDQIIKDIRGKAAKPNRKILVFTTFKDTAEYLYENLQPLAEELKIGMGIVFGDGARSTTGGRNRFNDVLDDFAPIARQRREKADDIDLLIATDCVSEGQNLQDCDTVINYDIHWNPVRVIQRFGRVDRLGSQSETVRMINYWPTRDMETYLKLRSRVMARMALADVTATGDDDPFTQETAETELQFRSDQLRKMLVETPDLDDADDGVSMSDFTLDHFITQLLRYLERNRKELEAMPLGAFSLAPANAPEGVAPGVIFFLRQRNPSEDPDVPKPSPIHPHYMVYVGEDRKIRVGCENPRRSLTAFETAAIGETEPITELCQRFDGETDRGADMRFYDRLLKAATRQIRNAAGRAQRSALRPDGDRNAKLAPRSKTPRDENDFDLVTWLIIPGDDKA